MTDERRDSEGAPQRVVVKTGDAASPRGATTVVVVKRPQNAGAGSAAPGPAAEGGSGASRVRIVTGATIVDGRCGSCGYDTSGLSGGLTQGVCPECGEAIAWVRAPERAPTPGLGFFLSLATPAYSLATIGSLVFGLAGVASATGGPGPIAGAAFLVLAAVCAAVVAWLVGRPRDYPRGRSVGEVVVAWLVVGLPAALFMAAIVLLGVGVVVVLVRLIVGYSIVVNVPLVVGVVGAVAVIGVAAGIVMTITRT